MRRTGLMLCLLLRRTETPTSKHRGPSFDDFLEKDGILDEVTEVAAKRVLAGIARPLDQQSLSKAEMARRMYSAPNQIRRLLNETDTGVTLHTIMQAAAPQVARADHYGVKTMTVKLMTFDAAEYLETDKDIAILPAETLATGNQGYISESIGTVARARGITAIARQSGINRETLFEAVNPAGSPRLRQSTP